ncbi:hypothetical protein [Sphingomonas sp. UYP23]
MIWVWTAVGLVAACYCIATGFAYLKQKRYVRGALGIISGVLLLFVPVSGQTSAVKIDLPA